jgi:hypothetical protein
MPGPVPPFILSTIAEARRKGWPSPVVLGMSVASAHARAVFEALKGEAMPSPPDGVSPEDDPGVCFCVCGECCRTLLTAHCGPGGAHVARQMAEDLGAIEGWFIALRSDHIALAGFAHGKKMLGAIQDYDSVRRGDQTLEELVNDEGPTHLTASSDDGDDVVIYGRTGADVALASGLVSIVLDREVSAPHQGKLVTVPVNDDMLADLLRRCYGKDDGPHQVAEAITALKKAPGNKHRWLLKVLWGRPELRDLARLVQTELTGRSTDV